jgi:hypothetical protein
VFAIACAQSARWIVAGRSRKGRSGSGAWLGAGHAWFYKKRESAFGTPFSLAVAVTATP